MIKSPWPATFQLAKQVSYLARDAVPAKNKDIARKSPDASLPFGLLLSRFYIKRTSNFGGRWAIICAAALSVSNASPEIDPFAIPWALQQNRPAALSFPRPEIIAKNEASEDYLALLSCRSGRDGRIASFVGAVDSSLSSASIIHIVTDVFPVADSEEIQAVMTFRMGNGDGQPLVREATASIDLKDCSTKTVIVRQ